MLAPHSTVSLVKGAPGRDINPRLTDAGEVDSSSFAADTSAGPGSRAGGLQQEGPEAPRGVAEH